MAGNIYKKRSEGSENKGGGSKYNLVSVPGFKEYKPKDGKDAKGKRIKNLINILKYKVGGKNHPLVRKGEMEVGDEDFMLTYFQHRVGPENTPVICHKRTFGKPCPCCEVKAELMEQGLDWDDPKVKPYNASERSLFYVQDVSGDVAGDVELFPVSSHLFTKPLLAAAGEDDMTEDYDDGFVEFAEPGKRGRIVQFTCKTEGTGKTKKTDYESFTFKLREQKFEQPGEDLELPSLDKFLKIHTYDEIKALMEGGDEEAEEEEEEKPKAPRAKPPVDDEEEKPKAEKPKPVPEPEEKEDPKIDFGDEAPSCPNGKPWGKADCYGCCQKCDPKIYDACCKAST